MRLQTKTLVFPSEPSLGAVPDRPAVAAFPPGGFWSRSNLRIRPWHGLVLGLRPSVCCSDTRDRIRESEEHSIGK